VIKRSSRKWVLAILTFFIFAGVIPESIVVIMCHGNHSLANSSVDRALFFTGIIMAVVVFQYFGRLE